MEYKDITPVNSPFLARLNYLEEPPEKLYFYGKIPEFDGKTEASVRFPDEIGRPKTVAIVGSRKMTNYGKEIAFRISAELASRGVIIASGLALGIDATAHKGALSVGGKTIAFLGTEITKIYPPRNKGLFEEIIKSGGAVFSEYAPGDAPGYRLGTDSFLRRNRLISGISDAVIVVEADERSGSLNTACHALSQGVPLFAIPGDINRQMSQGVNRLFNKGATAIFSADDVLEILYKKKPRRKKTILENLEAKNLVETEDEGLVVKALVSGARYNTEILEYIKEETSDFDAGRFMTAVTTLEIKGVIHSLDGNGWEIS